MISITCTQCRRRLEMDDAFAGGVCRCQFCGTIQTVPSHLKNKGKAKSSKPLYSKSGAGKSGTGLEELAEIVASSGLARGSLTKKPAKKSEGTGAAKPQAAIAALASNPRALLIGAGAVIVLLLGLVAYLAFMRGSPADRAGAKTTPVGGETSSVESSAGPQDQVAPAVPATPSFAGVPLESGNVVYLIDCSQANDEILDAAKAVAYRSALSLGPGRQFQIVFWHRTDEGVAAYPDDGLAPATPQEVQKAQKQLEDVVSYGSTELKPALEKAMKSRPAAIVLTTAKGLIFDEENVPVVQAAVKGSNVKVHTFALGEGETVALRRIAKLTGGEYRELSHKQFRAFAH